MKHAQCKKCLNKFYEKDIYTIQQFQYRKEPSYNWSLKFFEKLGITEWNSFCEECIISYSKKSKNAWKKTKNLKV
jgi:hypothetical protein